MFYELMRRGTPQHYYAFDLLWLDGRDLRVHPLIERKRLLRELVQVPVLYAAYFECSGMDLFKAACKHELEGIVAKLATGRYGAGSHYLGKDQEPRLQPGGRQGRILR